MAGTRGHPTGRKFDAEPSTVRGAHTESPCPTAEGARRQGITDERQKTVGLEQVFDPQVDAGGEHPAYDADDHAVGHHPACDAKAHTAGVCHPR